MLREPQESFTPTYYFTEGILSPTERKKLSQVPNPRTNLGPNPGQWQDIESWLLLRIKSCSLSLLNPSSSSPPHALPFPGSLVPWFHDPLVPGLLSPWSLGSWTLGSWSFGSGSLGPLVPGFPVPSVPGPSVPWLHWFPGPLGSLVPGFPGPLVPWSLGSQSLGPLVPRFPGPLVPSPLVLWSLSSLVPWFPVSWFPVPWSSSPLLPWSIGSRVSLFLGQLVGLFQQPPSWLSPPTWLSTSLKVKVGHHIFP